MCSDPVKVTILTPGSGRTGQYERGGDPGGAGGKIPRRTWDRSREKTGPYNLLFSLVLVSIKPKAMGLLRGLTEFKRSYDLNLRDQKYATRSLC